MSGIFRKKDPREARSQELPVILLAVAVDFGLKKAFYANTLAEHFEKYAKFMTGWIFVVVGISKIYFWYYLTLSYL